MTGGGAASAFVRRVFASLDSRNYRRYLAGQAVSYTGTWMQTVAQAWLVLQLTGSGTALGVLAALQTVPVLVLGPYGGVVADRTDKRRLLIAVQSAMGALALVLGVLTLTGGVALWHVFGLAFLLGLGQCFDNPARQAFTLEMVDPDRVRNAVTLNSVLVNAARAVGPALAGLVIAAGSTGICFVLNAVSFAVVALSLTRLDRSALRPTPPTGRAPGQLRDGLRYVARTRELAVPLLMMALVGCLAYEFQVVLPVVAEQTFAGDARAYGLMTGAMGVGAVLGGLVVAARGRTGIRAMVLSALAFGAAMAGTAAAPSLPVAVAALVLVGTASISFLSAGSSTLQLAAAPTMRGRVMALWSVAFIGSTPIGGPIVGAVAEHVGGRAALAVGAVTCLLAAALGTLLLRRPPRAVPVPD
ncbi:MFS transporter [Geodermatophilus sp. CPCC 206100]|uniref:MFS transporter n=1 Tax=Geodermatophilus sp. CPCC 206100 TaxID=3020054 RepID=UPI003B0073C0